MQSKRTAARKLKALVESDPGALIRILQFFQARNVIPLSVSAQRVGAEFVEIEIDVAHVDLCDEGLRLTVARVNELPIAICAVVCD
jgi:hypothetical protein